MIAVPEHLLPLLHVTAAREVRLASQALDWDVPAGDEFEAKMAGLRLALAAFDGFGRSMEPEPVVFLADETLLWEAGDDEVCLPRHLAEADELIARVEALRDLIHLRNAAAKETVA